MGAEDCGGGDVGVGCARTEGWLVEGVQDSGDVTAQLGVFFGGQDAIDVRPGLLGWGRLGPVFVFQPKCCWAVS